MDLLHLEHVLDTLRRTLRVFRDCRYVPDSAQRFIDIVKEFNWSGWLPSQPLGSGPLRRIEKAS